MRTKPGKEKPCYMCFHDYKRISLPWQLDAVKISVNYNIKCPNMTQIGQRARLTSVSNAALLIYVSLPSDCAFICENNVSHSWSHRFQFHFTP